MSGPIKLKGDPIAVAWAMRWLAGDLPMDYERRRPTTQAECDDAWLRYRAITLLNEDETKDQAEEEDGTYR